MECAITEFLEACLCLYLAPLMRGVCAFRLVGFVIVVLYFHDDGLEALTIAKLRAKGRVLSVEPAGKQGRL
jgi:hypothetical protein